MFAQARGSLRISFRPGFGITKSFADTFLIPKDAENLLNDTNTGVICQRGFLTTVTNEGSGGIDAMNGSYHPPTEQYNVLGTPDTAYNDIQIPYYNRAPSHITPTSPWMYTGDISSVGPQNALVPKATINSEWSISTRPPATNEDTYYAWAYRAIGEDFSMGYFTGTYPITQTNPIDSNYVVA